MYIARWLNGFSESNIDLNDRGLAYGDGLFETIALFGGNMPFFEMHIERLKLGCQQLQINCDFTQLRREITQALANINWTLWPRSSLKIIITREYGGRGYYPSKDSGCNRILFLMNYREPDLHYHQQGVNTKICNTPCSVNPMLAGIKHLARLDSVMARAEWDAEFFEGFMLDIDRNLIEGTMSNVFLVKNDTLLTPKLDRCGVAGIMRRFIIEKLAPQLDINLAVQPLKEKDLLSADEVFISNSLLGICPVSNIESYVKPVGDITQRLRRALTDYIERSV